jgi:murein DD-endopeptidase MepM/ murein hydrolase activator NlpD
MQLKLYLPTKPCVILQPFGGNPAYYARFLDAKGNPEKGHMGIDFQAAHATPLPAVCDGMARYVTDSHGGDGIYIQPHGTYDYEGGQAYFEVINWHLCSKDDPQFKPLIPTDGASYPVKAGQIIGYTDNSGAPFESSGDHLHLGLLPVGANGLALHPGNGFGGCINALPYFNGIFAGDANKVAAVVSEAATIIPAIATSNLSPAEKQQDLTWLQQILASFLNWIQK